MCILKSEVHMQSECMLVYVQSFSTGGPHYRIISLGDQAIWRLSFSALLTQGFPPFEKLAFLIYYISSGFCYQWFSLYTYLFSYTLTSFHGKDDWRRASSPIWLVPSWLGKFNGAGWATGWMVLNARLGSLCLIVWAKRVCAHSLTYLK